MKKSHPSRFAATRWTLVVRANGNSEDARVALRELCDLYYDPIVTYIKHWRYDQEEDAARDQAHAFFENLLAREQIGNPDPEKGSFRNYLLGSVKHFLLTQHRANNADRKGGKIEHLSLEHITAPNQASDNSLVFDRSWAITLINQSLAELEEDMISAGKDHQFEVLKPWLDGNGIGSSQENAASTLGISVNATKVAIHRLRERFRKTIRSHVAATVADPREIEGEIQHLFEILCREK